ncbi:Hint domain-containing protein [Roseomonas sp. CECT 9278]|uniref:Hint domain-containing protein n=1 Tax=Roseomonas sp. CECT 9278 TaxID=2845823 RepID=UPI001E5258FD|nr:Hint domain-containing protein [Roseomonas sp. CECT 9278]CAH0306803.1 hypothetical protein ROS9278_04760 [Roseomonas sp. CECT 9278]
MSGNWNPGPRPGNGDDVFTGTSGNDAAAGRGGNDSLAGREGNDLLVGGDGNDTLSGGPGTDVIKGGAGDDLISWKIGDGDDFIFGGSGADAFSLEGWTGGTDDPWEVKEVGPASVFIRKDGTDKDYVTIFDYDPTKDVVVCFAEGTRIATARGEVPVETLRAGDLVVVAHGTGAPLQPVVWMGHARTAVARHPDPASVAPVLIRAGALADGVPYRDLRVSPEHALFLDGRLVPARLLVNGRSIVQEGWCPEVTYWHVEVPGHGLLVAEGAVAESYFDDGNRKHFDNGVVTTLVKDFASARANGRYAEAACYPLLLEGPALEVLRARLAGRAAAPAPARRTA